MTKKTRRAVFSLSAVAVCFLLQILPFRERSTYRCDICFAERDLFQWRFGNWGMFSIPLSPHAESVSETKFREDFLPQHNEHTWAFAQGSPYYLGAVWGGCAIGRGRHVSQALWLYESHPEFRSFIAKKITDGSLTAAQIIEAFSERSAHQQVNGLTQTLVDEFFQAE